MTEEEPAPKPKASSSYQFIPQLRNQKITVRPAQGQPITGILRGFNPYELLLEVGNKQIVIFKALSGAWRPPPIA